MSGRSAPVSGRSAPGSRLALVLAVVASTAALSAALLPAPPARADAVLQWYQHYERGLERAEAADWSGALADFRAAQQTEPRPRARVRTYGSRFVFDYDPVFQEARALAELGQLDAAAARLEVAAEAGVTPASDLDAVRRRIAERRAAAAAAPAAPRGSLRVDTQPQGAEVRLDGRRLGLTPLAPVEVVAGPHRVVLRAPGHAEWGQVVDVRAAEATHLQVVLPPAPPPSAAANALEATGGGGGAGEDVDGSAEGDRREAGRPAGAGEAGGGAAGATDTARRAGAAPEGGGSTGETGGTSGPASVPFTERDRTTPAGTGPAAAAAPTGAAAPPAAPPTAPPTESAQTSGVGDTAAEGSPLPHSPSRSPGSADSGPPAADGSSRDAVPPSGRGAAVADEAATRATPFLPPGALVGGALASLALAVLVAAWLLRSRRVHPGARRAAWRLQPGGQRRVGDYRVDDELGRGGMATTYRARRVSDGRTVALKIPHETGDPTYLERFVREGRLGETLHHPGIVRIFEAGEDRGLAFLAMELLPGHTLEAEIARHPQGMPLRAALEIARDVAEALDYAHGKGIVHRDLKPANVMLLPDGTRKVMDFGVARIAGQPGLTTSQVFFGSPVYAAPELAGEPRDIGPRSDLYSLGIVLFELLEGRPPFVHESVLRLLELHRGEPLPAGADLPRPLPPEVWSLVTRLCAKSPADRYPDAQTLLVDLDRLLYALHEEPEPAQGRTA